MQKWNIYEITTEETKIHGVMLRGRVRKFALQHNTDLLTENASDKENTVRFALHVGQPSQQVEDFVRELISDAMIQVVLEEVENPVLSKLKVNNEERYEI